MSYAKKRYITYAFITLLILIIPFITINGNHLLLLSFEKFEFHIIGFVFSVSEFYVMPFLLMLLFIGIFAITAVLGRFWCGWACPQTIFRVIYRDLIEGTLLDLRKIKNKQKELKHSKVNYLVKKSLAMTLWALLSIIISINFILYFIPYEDFFIYIQNPLNHMYLFVFILGLAAFLIFDIIYLKENFCTYICPYSITQSTLYDNDTKHTIYNKNRGGSIYEKNEKNITNLKQWKFDEECTTCEACVKICPTHIDIRKGLQFECINCLECADACTTVMGNLGKESLITWNSTNLIIHNIKNSIFSKRNLMFVVVLLSSLILALIFASEKEYLLIDSDKVGPSYRIDKNGVVFNSYVVAIHNTQNKAYTYDIKLTDNDSFIIKRFKPFKLGAHKRRKKILIIESKRDLSISYKQDTILKVQIIITAKEDEKVKASQTLAFIYPSAK
jgi:cytochrome c oxidase accessory protein FixG